jgi:hypothetical protein
MEHKYKVPERSLDELRHEAPEQLLQVLRQGKLKGREIYRAVQVFGEKRYQAARPEVEALLNNDDPELRFVALKVLTRYWHLAEHWETARQVLLNDPEVECRFRAASDLGGLERNTQDRRTLVVLADVVCNEAENPIVRESAYAAMLEVIAYNPKEQFRLATNRGDFTKEVDWDLVRQYCNSE